jgi:hypothetical protein
MRTIGICLLAFSATISISAQGTQPNPPQLATNDVASSQAAAPTNNATALDKLEMAARAQTGSSAVISNFIATGTMTRFLAGEEVSSSAVWKAQSTGEVRLDANFEGLPKSLLISGGYAKSIDIEGKLSPAANDPEGQAVLGLLSLSSWKIKDRLADHSTVIELVTEPADASTIHLRWTTRPEPQKGHKHSTTKPPAIDVYLDAKTFLVRRFVSELHAPYGGDTTYAYELDFDDYRSEQGLMLPFLVTEKVTGQTTWKLAIDTYTVNTDLPEIAFAN